MNIQAQNFQTGQRLTAKDLNDLKNAVMNPNISLGDGLVGSSGNGSITIQKSESLSKKAKEYTNTVWQLKSAPSQRFIHEDSDGNRYPSLYVYVGSTLANAFENINIQNQWIAQGTKPTALYLLNGKESPKCTTYLAEVDEKGAITKGDEVDISLDTAASQTEIDLQSDFYAKDRDIGIDGWLELPVAIADATGTYMCVFQNGPLLVVGLFFCDLTVEQNIESNSQDETNNFVSYSIEPNLVDIVSQLVTSDYGWGGMIGNPVPMFSCRPLADYETLKTEFLDNDMIVDFEKFKIISQFRNVQQFQFIDTVSQMPYAFKPVFFKSSDPEQDLSSINIAWAMNMIVPEVATPSSYDDDGTRDNVYASTSSIRKVPTLESIPKIVLPGETPYREIDVRQVYRLTQIGFGGSAIYIAPLIASSGAPDADTFPVTDLTGTFRNEDGQTGGINPLCLGGALDALFVRSNVSLPLDDNSKTLLLKCVPVWSLQLGTWIYGFWIEQSSLEALDGFNVGSRNGVKNTDQIVAALLPNTKEAFVESALLKNGEKVKFNIGFNKNLKLRPLTPAYVTVDLRNIAAALPYTDSQFINGLKRQDAQYKNMTTAYQSNYEQLSAEMTNNDNQDLGNKLFSRSGSIDYRIVRPGGTNDSETFAKANYPIELMGFGLVPPISVDANRTTPDYENNVTDLSDIIKNDLVIRHYWQDTPGDLTENTVGQVLDYINMQSLLSAWTELCCQTSVDISAITDAVLSADNADWQNRYFLKCRVNDDPEDYNYGKVQVFLGKTTSRLDAHCTVGGMPVNYYRDKNDNVLASDDKGWCTLPYSPGSKLYYWIGAEWDTSNYFYKYTLYITDVQMIPANTGKDIVREEGFLYYQNANPNAYAYDLADYTTTGDVRKTNIDDASTWANRIYNIHLGDIHCNPFPNEIEPFTFGLGRDGYWKVYEGGDYLVYYNNEPINKHGSMLAVSIPPYGYNSGDGWADTNIPLTADVNLYFVFSDGSGSSQSMPEWDFVNGYPMPFSNGIRLVAGSNWDGTGIPMEITQYHKGKIFIDYDMGDVNFSDCFNPDTKCYSIERKDDSNDHFTLYQFASTTPTMSPITLQWSDTDPDDILSSNHFLVKNTTNNNTLEYLIPLIDAGRVNDLSAAIDELSGSVPTPGDIEQMLEQLSADIIDSTDDKYWHLGNQSASEAYGSVIGNSNQDTVIDLDHLMLDGSDWTVMNSFMVNGNLDVHNDCNLYGTLYYQTYEWQSAPINVGGDFMEILVAANYGDPETILNAIQSGIESATAWSNAVVASSYGTFQGVLNAIANAAQAAQNAQNAANAAQGAANAAQAGVNALDSQINGANGIDARLSAAESNITSLDTRYNLLSGDVDTIGNQLNIQGQAIHDIADAISGDIVPAINGISSVVNNNVTQITNIDGRVTNIENNYTTVTNNLSNLSTDVGTLSNDLSSAQNDIAALGLAYIGLESSLQNKADLSSLNDLSDSLSNYVEKYTTEVQTISTPLVDLQPLSAFELNAAYGTDSGGMFVPYGTVTLNNSSGDKTILYPARTVTERVGGRMKQVYHTPEIASYKSSTSATYTLKVPYKNGTIAVEEELSAYLPLSGGTISSDTFKWLMSNGSTNMLSVDPVGGNYALGNSSEAGPYLALAIGTNAHATGGAVAIGGLNAWAYGNNSIQIGTGSNIIAGTTQIKDWQLLDANGNIPEARLSSVGYAKKDDLSAYLSSETDPIFNDWLSADNVAAGKDSGVSATAAYDCAVEWLQTDGTAYIDTGIVGTNSLKVEINFDEDPSTTMDGIALPFGARTSTTSNIFGLRYAGQNNSTTPGRFSLDYDTQTNKIAQNQNTTRPILVKAGKAMPTYSNVLLGTNGEQWATSVVDFESGLNNYLFACNSNGTAVVRGTGATVLSRIYYCKIWNNTVLVRDFIPVRKNGVGYMFDRVSKTLFGNVAGSGAFTYGNDAEAQNLTTTIAIGKDAVATDNALQLGNGTNDSPKSFYIGNALLLDQNGKIQKESIDPDFLQNLNLRFSIVNVNFQNIETAIGGGWKETANLTVGSLASGFSFSTDGSTWNNKVRFFHWGQMGFIVGTVRRSSALAAGTVYGSIGKISVPSGFSFMAAGGSNGDHRTTMAIAASGSVSICPVTAIAANAGISIRGFIPVGTINDKYQKRYATTI